MKMTKELKKMLLKGFEEKLIELWGSEKIAQEYENAGNKEDRDFWIKKRISCQAEILSAIDSLIEVEGEENEIR